MGIAIVIALIGAAWSAAVASNKNLSVVGYALLGFFFPLIGVLIVHCTATRPATQPTNEEVSAQ